MFLLSFFAMLPLSSTAWTRLLSRRGNGAPTAAAFDLRLKGTQDAFFIFPQILLFSAFREPLLKIFLEI
jgi:hypothetical protein